MLIFSVPKMATADWSENWPEDCTSESPNNQEADEEESESYSLTHDTESRPTESTEAPKHPGIPELENIPSHVEMDSLQRSADSFRYVCARMCKCYAQCLIPVPKCAPVLCQRKLSLNG